MSEPAYIDSTKGPHAAAELTDHQVEYLCKLVLWEVSVRLPEHQYKAYLERQIQLRTEHAGLIERAKQERDLMDFEAQVLADLADLPISSDDAAA